MFERLSGDYNRGFTRGIQKCIEMFDNTDCNFAMNRKRWNAKLIRQLLECCLENRENLRESDFNPNASGFIRWNVTTEKFEWYDPYEKKGENMADVSDS